MPGFRRSLRWRSAKRRYRRLRYRRKLRRARMTRRRMNTGLDYTVQPFACHIVNQQLSMPATTRHSYVYRITALGVGSNTASNWLGRIAECDPRFVRLCALYQWFQIRNMYVEIVLNTKAGVSIVPGYASIGGNPTQEVSRLVMFARVVRSCQYATAVTSWDQMMVDPGTVSSKCLNAESYPRLVFSLRPRTKEERLQWISTKLDSYNVDYWEYNQVFFSPAVDFVLSCPEAIKWKGIDVYDPNTFYVNIRVRYTIAFRNSSSVYQARESVADIIGESKTISDLGNILKKSPNRSVDPENPTEPNGLTVDENDAADADDDRVDPGPELVDDPMGNTIIGTVPSRYNDRPPHEDEGQRMTRFAGAAAGLALGAQILRRMHR